jgi:hypothetical protein
MISSYIYLICWRIKSAFYERQHGQRWTLPVGFVGRAGGIELGHRRRSSVRLSQQWQGVTPVDLWPPKLIENLHHKILVPLLSSNCDERQRINAHEDLPWWLGFRALRMKFDLFWPIFIGVFTPNRSLCGLLLIPSGFYLWLMKIWKKSRKG